MRHAQPGGDGSAVAVVPVEQLQHGGGPPEGGGPVDRLRPVDGIDEPDEAVGGKRVRRALHRLVDGPREAVPAEVVAEAHHRASSVPTR